jgi:hypothetical protein
MEEYSGTKLKVLMEPWAQSKAIRMFEIVIIVVF